MADEVTEAAVEATGAVANKVAEAAVEATRAAFDFSFQTGVWGGCSLNLKIDNAWLAAGAVAVAGVVTVGSFYIHRKYPAQNANPIHNALENQEAGVVDPEVRGIEDGSILVELFCHTEQSFLSFMDDFEAKKIKLRLEEEFSKIGYGEELEVTITNLDEVHRKLNQIRHNTIRLGTWYQCQSKYAEAKELYERAIDITRKTGERKGEQYVHGNLGTVFGCLGGYVKANEYLQNALAITKEMGDRRGEASACGKLGAMFQSLGEYGKAKEYLEKALAIALEIGDRIGEASADGNLGTVYQSIGEYAKAKEYLEKALAITKEIGDRQGEASAYGNLGTVNQSIGEYAKAKEYLEKALAMRKEIGDRQGEASAYGNLGTVYQSVSEYAKAEEYFKKALAITKEIGDRQGEASAYGNLGIVFQSVGEYVKAEEYLEKALAITKEVGDRHGEASAYGNLGSVFQCLGDYVKAQEHLVKALVITKEIGDSKGEASAYGNLGTVFQSLGEHRKAEEYLKKALAIRKEIGDRKGEASSFANLGTVYQSLGEHAKAEEYLENALKVSKEIGDRNGEASAYGILGNVFQNLGENVKAKEYYLKGLQMSKEMGDVENEFQCFFNLTWITFLEGNMRETLSDLFDSINKLEVMRGLLRDNDQLKISFFEDRDFSYWMFSVLLCAVGKINEALYALELGRARALADLMSAEYSVKQQISADPESWIGIENIIKKESNCTCLYYSCSPRHIFLWILKTSGDTFFREIDIDEKNWAVCDSRGICPQLGLPLEHNTATYRLIEDDDEHEFEELAPTLSQCYEIMIAPVADLLKDPEIIIVPDRALYKVTFAALRDESGKYLSETFRIRIVPSLTTLQLIQDAPADYHSQTGALIVGDPEVGEVMCKGHLENVAPMPGARREAEIVGQLLGAQPLLGKLATKQAVIQSMGSVRLIHIAAHGNAERGEIMLAPLCKTTGFPQEEDYLLTISDISRVQVRARLVVLSCCHSGAGPVGPEGVNGIARAFLGSGARSVLVAQWAIGDKATELLMSRFYEHLIRGESASESLHQAMKWMRGNGYSDVRDWAPFVLIGDNVTFEFDDKVPSKEDVTTDTHP